LGWAVIDLTNNQRLCGTLGAWFTNRFGVTAAPALYAGVVQEEIHGFACCFSARGSG